MRAKTITIARELAALLEGHWPAINARIDTSGVPVCRIAEDSLKSKLKDTEAQLSELREERVGLQKAAEGAKDAYAASNEGGNNGPKFRQAVQARDKLSECDAAIEAQRTTQEEILRLVSGASGGRRGSSDRNGPRSGDGGGNGWATAARELDLASGRTRVDMPASDLLAAGFNLSPSEGLTAPAIVAPFMQKAQPRQFLYPSFSTSPVEPGDLALTEFRQSGSRKLSGESVERDPAAVTAKAKLELSVDLVTPSLVQWAAVVDEVPSKLFDSIPAFQAFLENELSYQLQLAIDAHCIAAIAASAPPTGESGATLIEKARNAIAAMRGLGANPTVLALSPIDAAALDVQKSTGSEEYIFATRDSGSSSPLYGCSIVEVANLTHPTLVDPRLAGVLYLGDAFVLVDPYSGMATNQVRIRCEADGLLHVRDVAGIYVIAAEGEGE